MVKSVWPREDHPGVLHRWNIPEVRGSGFGKHFFTNFTVCCNVNTMYSYVSNRLLFVTVAGDSKPVVVL